MSDTDTTEVAPATTAPRVLRDTIRVALLYERVRLIDRLRRIDAQLYDDQQARIAAAAKVDQCSDPNEPRYL